MSSRSINKVKEYYDNCTEVEWMRLENNIVEFAVTKAYLTKYLQKASNILDIGGGPGRYSIELSKMGHKVTLFDLSPQNIEFACKKAKEENVLINDFKNGDARDLSRFVDCSFDAVINFGPLYHLTDESERIAAIKESIRVLKPKGKLFVAFISKYAPIYCWVTEHPERIIDIKSHLVKFLSNGIKDDSSDILGFTHAYFIDPNEISSLMNQYKLNKIAIVGAEGFLAQTEAKIKLLDKSLSEEWLDLAIQTAETEAAVLSSQHIIYIGEKQ